MYIQGKVNESRIGENQSELQQNSQMIQTFEKLKMPQRQMTPYSRQEQNSRKIGK